MMAFYDALRPFYGNAFDDVGIQRPLHQEIGIFYFGGLFLEHGNKLMSYYLAFAFRIRNACKFIQKALLRINKYKIFSEPLSENLLYPLGLAGTQHAVIDEYTGKLFSHGLVNHYGGNRGINPAGKRTDNLAFACLLFYLFCLFAYRRAHAPGGRFAENSEYKILYYGFAFWRMFHFWMELHAEYIAFYVANHGIGAVFGTAVARKTLRQPAE